MKKLFLFIMLLTGIITISCEDNLSPKAEFKEEYALYGVINVDTSFQTIYLSRSYSVDGYNGLDNRVDPSLTGANVKLEVLSIALHNRVWDTTVTATYHFREAEAPRKDVSRYTTPVKYYAIDNYKPSDGENIRITAVLNNNKILTSNLIVPPISYLYYVTSTVNYDPAMEEENGYKGIKFGWSFLSIEYNTTTQYFAPRLEINYHKADNPGNKLKMKVPYYFIPEDGNYLPLYPKVSTSTTAQFYGDSVERTLRLISEGDANKSNYVIDAAEFTLLLLDKNLASFLAAENTFKDEFSTRIDAPDFTNVKGGIGMFGAVATKKTIVKISPSFINSFGYRTSY